MLNIRKSIISALSGASILAAVPAFAQQSQGRIADSAVGQAGRRQTSAGVGTSLQPHNRISSRIENRVESRVRNRIDPSFDPSSDGAGAVGAAVRRTATTTRR